MRFLEKNKNVLFVVMMLCICSGLYVFPVQAQEEGGPPREDPTIHLVVDEGKQQALIIAQGAGYYPLGKHSVWPSREKKDEHEKLAKSVATYIAYDSIISLGEKLSGYFQEAERFKKGHYLEGVRYIQVQDILDGLPAVYVTLGFPVKLAEGTTVAAIEKTGIICKKTQLPSLEETDRVTQDIFNDFSKTVQFKSEIWPGDKDR